MQSGPPTLREKNTHYLPIKIAKISSVGKQTFKRQCFFRIYSILKWFIIFWRNHTISFLYWKAEGASNRSLNRIIKGWSGFEIIATRSHQKLIFINIYDLKVMNFSFTHAQISDTFTCKCVQWEWNFQENKRKFWIGDYGSWNYAKKLVDPWKFSERLCMKEYFQNLTKI